jgi:hypothetical protein
MDSGFDDYEHRIRTIFSLAREGSLRDVADQLVGVSRYLLENVENLGLTRDHAELYDSRLRLWEEFNRAWLVPLQKQYDMTQSMLRSGQQPREPQSVMSAQTLEGLGQQLVHLCDMIEKHGLVDYAVGVAEEEIIDCKF